MGRSASFFRQIGVMLLFTLSSPMVSAQETIVTFQKNMEVIGSSQLDLDVPDGLFFFSGVEEIWKQPGILADRGE